MVCSKCKDKPLIKGLRCFECLQCGADSFGMEGDAPICSSCSDKNSRCIRCGQEITETVSKPIILEVLQKAYIVKGKEVKEVIFTGTTESMSEWYFKEIASKEGSISSHFVYAKELNKVLFLGEHAKENAEVYLAKKLNSRRNIMNEFVIVVGKNRADCKRVQEENLALIGTKYTVELAWNNPQIIGKDPVLTLISKFAEGELCSAAKIRAKSRGVEYMEGL